MAFICSKFGIIEHSTAAAAEEGEGDSKRNYYSEIEMCQVIVDDDDLGKQIDKLQ